MWPWNHTQYLEKNLKAMYWNAWKGHGVEHLARLGCDFIFNKLSHHTVIDRSHIECGQSVYVNLGGRCLAPSGDCSHHQPCHFVRAGPPAEHMNQPSWPLPFPVLRWPQGYNPNVFPLLSSPPEEARVCDAVRGFPWLAGDTPLQFQTCSKKKTHASFQSKDAVTVLQSWASSFTRAVKDKWLIPVSLCSEIGMNLPVHPIRVTEYIITV